jgi:predicted secreted acid phosphatase
MNFKRTICYSVLITAGLLSATASFAKEPKNLDLVKETYIKYHDSGEYLRDQTKVADSAMLYLKNRLATEKKSPTHKKFAIVLDIDETSLSNYPDMVKMSFGGTMDQICDAEGKGTDPAIKPTLELYRYAKANGVAVFFITGRYENYRDATAKNLQNVGYKDYDGLVLKPLNYHENSPAPYKTAERVKIEKQGFDIVLNMGDEPSDLAGGHADKTFKFPDPYYYIP